MTTSARHELIQGGLLDLTSRPTGVLLEQFIDLLTKSDDTIRSLKTAEESFQRLFGDEAESLLGFTKGYVAGVNTLHNTFQIVGIIKPNRWEDDGDWEVIEGWIGTQRPIQTQQGLLVKKIVTEKLSYITPDYSRDVNVSLALRKHIQLHASIVSPLVVSNEVVGYVLLGYRNYPSAEIQWMHEYLIRHTAVTVMQTFWADKFRREVEHSVRWSLLGQQAGALMHDLNTPIGTLNNCLQTLNNRKDVSEDNKKTIYLAISQVARIKDTVANLLSFVRDIDLRYKNVEARKLIEDARRTARADAAKAHITGHALDKLIYVDPIKIALVLRNLINNAYESPMPEGYLGDRVVEIRADSGDRELTISVLDNGSGLSDETRPLVFEPFFSTKPNGHGLGLAVAERFVKAHGGRIRARNREEGGACFEITLPLKAAGVRR